MVGERTKSAEQSAEISRMSGPGWVSMTHTSKRSSIAFRKARRLRANVLCCSGCRSSPSRSPPAGTSTKGESGTSVPRTVSTRSDVTAVTMARFDSTIGDVKFPW
jgi:hypothetical protein